MINAPYYIIILFMFILTLFEGRSENVNGKIISSRKDKTLFMLGTIVLLVFSVLKDPFIYPDILNYSYIFDYGMEGTLSEESINIGYLLINRLFRVFSHNFVVFSAFITCVTSFSWFFFIKKTSIKPVFSLFIYILVIYFPSFWLWKQYMALVFVLIAYSAVLERNFLKYCLFVFIATSMHTTAIIVFPVYFFYWFRLEPKRLALLFVLTIILYVVFFKAIAFFILQANDYYSNYLTIEQNSQRLVIKLFYVLIFAYALGKNIYKKDAAYLMFILAIMNVILYVGGSGIYGLFRLKLYFDASEIIGVPILLQIANKSKISKKVLLYCSIILYVGALCYSAYTFIESDNFLFGYHTIFNPLSKIK